MKHYNTRLYPLCLMLDFNHDASSSTIHYYISILYSSITVTHSPDYINTVNQPALPTTTPNPNQ